MAAAEAVLVALVLALQAVLERLILLQDQASHTLLVEAV
jgi:hypothetical protein